MRRTGLLVYALLGLLAGKPYSGYELRKFFTSTPMRHFSDSPGSVYPALRRLEESRFVRAIAERRDNPRGRQRYVPTRAGLAELDRWLALPVEHDVVDRPEAFLLRFSFMDGRLPRSQIIVRLREYRDRVRAYADELGRVQKTMGPDLPPCASLALQNGVLSHITQAEWAEHALSRLLRVKGES